MDERFTERADGMLSVRLTEAARRVIEIMEARGMDVSREACDMIVAFGLDAGWLEDNGEEIRVTDSDF